MIYLAVVTIFLVVFMLVLMVYQRITVNQISIKSRLKKIEETTVINEDAEPLSLPFKLRVINPLQAKLINFFSRLLPANLKTSVEQKLIQCGNPRGMKANVFLTGVIVGSIVLTIVCFIFPLILGLGFKKAFLFALVALIVSVLLPVLWLYMAADKRIKQIERTLPDAIDLLVVSVEAGLGFDMAMTKVTERIKGPLGDEFARAMNEMKMGKNRQAALRDLSSRAGSDNLHSFLSMIIQGTTMGFAIGPILRIQSETMRRERRQRVEEAAMKAPIKMVFPLVFCIFPALFIVILGPAIIQVIKAL